MAAVTTLVRERKDEVGLAEEMMVQTTRARMMLVTETTTTMMTTSCTPTTVMEATKKTEKTTRTNRDPIRTSLIQRIIGVNRVTVINMATYMAGTIRPAMQMQSSPPGACSQATELFRGGQAVSQLILSALATRQVDFPFPALPASLQCHLRLLTGLDFLEQLAAVDRLQSRSAV